MIRRNVSPNCMPPSAKLTRRERHLIMDSAMQSETSNLLAELIERPVQCHAPKKQSGGPTQSTKPSKRFPGAKSLPTVISHASSVNVWMQLYACWIYTNHFSLVIAQRPRQVGVCLKVLPSPESGSYFNSNTVPWQRVINSKGMISHRCVCSRLPIPNSYIISNWTI